MDATVLDLRKNMKKVLSAIDRNERVSLTYRGNKKAIIVPYREQPERKNVREHSAFGMWKDREDIENVNAIVRELRKGRKF